MNVTQLKKMFPELKVSRAPFIPESDQFYFHQGPYFVAVPEQGLSEHDRQLLACFTHTETLPHYTVGGQLWYDVLVNGEPPDEQLLGRHVQFILFHLDDELEHTIACQWRTSLEAFFNQPAVIIYFNASEGAIIDCRVMHDDVELEAIANTLTNDFSVTCHFQFGLRHRVTPEIQQLYMEQKKLFLDTSQLVSSVESSLVQSLHPRLNQWHLINEVRGAIRKDSGCAALIRALWQQQGNISLAAKQLYMHRNTLQYRMDKFYAHTAISLRTMDGLVLAYLCL
ncbi:MAG: helix-turn-helix domain-containing protein [Sporolactobacillus sp.]